MTINIGRGVRQQSSILRPMNSGMAHIARERLAQYIGMQNERHMEAVRVDGVSTEIWIKQLSGRVCSCMNPELHCSHCIDATPLSKPEEVNKNPFKFNISSPIDIDTAVNYPNKNTKEGFDVLDHLQAQSDNLETDWTSEFDIDPNRPLDIIEQDGEIFNVGESSLLFGGTRSACGICFGTGYTGGYQLINGKRLILDTTLEHNIKGGYIDVDTKPYTFVLSSDINAYVEFEIDVPIYFNLVHSFKICNNVEPIFGCVVMSEDGTNFYPMSLENLNKLKNRVNKIWVRVIGDFKKELRFTHVEINYELAEFPLIDYPPFARQENFQYFEALQTTNFEVTGNVPYIDRECVFGEVKTGYLWRAVSATQHMDANRQLFKTDVEARLIQRSEALYLLNGVYRPVALYNYRGLERIQGLTAYIDRTWQNINGI